MYLCAKCECTMCLCAKRKTMYLCAMHLCAKKPMLVVINIQQERGL